MLNTQTNVWIILCELQIGADQRENVKQKFQFSKKKQTFLALNELVRANCRIFPLNLWFVTLDLNFVCLFSLIYLSAWSGCRCVDFWLFRTVASDVGPFLRLCGRKSLLNNAIIWWNCSLYFVSINVDDRIALALHVMRVFIFDFLFCFHCSFIFDEFSSFFYFRVTIHTVTVCGIAATGCWLIEITLACTAHAHAIALIDTLSHLTWCHVVLLHMSHCHSLCVERTFADCPNFLLLIHFKSLSVEIMIIHCEKTPIKRMKQLSAVFWLLHSHKWLVSRFNQTFHMFSQQSWRQYRSLTIDETRQSAVHSPQSIQLDWMRVNIVEKLKFADFDRRRTIITSSLRRSPLSLLLRECA